MNKMLSFLGIILIFLGIILMAYSNTTHEYYVIGDVVGEGGTAENPTACNPELLISDEPATALDVIVAAQVLKLLRELKQKLNLAMILITHDLSIIAETCEKIAVMYAGNVVEYGRVLDIFKEPLHPYTQGLLSVFPGIKASKTRLTSIPGLPPDLLRPPPGCRFNPRCKYAMEICRKTKPELVAIHKEHYVACHLLKS